MLLNHFSTISHDGLISSISHYDDSVDLYFRLVNGLHCKISFMQVVEFRVTDFGKQNIISRVINFDGITARAEDMTYILNWISSHSDSSTYWTDQQIDSLIKEIKNSELSLMYIEPSVGAECAILYKNYNFKEINPKN